jgi:polyisoprenoid-binding protein YceI
VNEEGAIANYRINNEISRFTVRGFAGGLLSKLGHNPVLAIRDFSGEAHFEPDALEKSSLYLKIKAGSLEVQNDAPEKDRREMKRVMNEQVLEVTRYPEIVFESTAVSGAKAGEGSYRLVIEGKLTLHGVTRRLSIPAQVWATKDQLRANGEFSVRQTDYGIQLASVAGGVLKLKDELKFTYGIVGGAIADDRKNLCA